MSVQQGQISEITIVGGDLAGAQAAKCPANANLPNFLHHLADELISDGKNKDFRFVDVDGVHWLNRRDVTSITITFETYLG